jgi:hypothetical protein
MRWQARLRFEKDAPGSKDVASHGENRGSIPLASASLFYHLDEFTSAFVASDQV